MECLKGSTTLQALGGVNLPCGWYCVRGQPPLLEVEFTHTHTYYRDMWARRSEMLAPLTDLVGECSKTKTTRMNKIKKNLGGRIQFINKRLTM